MSHAYISEGNCSLNWSKDFQFYKSEKYPPHTSPRIDTIYMLITATYLPPIHINFLSYANLKHKEPTSPVGLVRISQSRHRL